MRNKIRMKEEENLKNYKEGRNKQGVIT